MARSRARRGLPERWLLPPAPREPDLAARFRSEPFDARRRLARLDPGELGAAGRADVEVVAGLARARLATAWRLHVAGPVLGWLVLMTVWGFGRSTYPTVVDRWFVAGLVLGGAAWLMTARHTARRLRAARRRLVACGAFDRAGGRQEP